MNRRELLLGGLAMAAAPGFARPALAAGNPIEISAASRTIEVGKRAAKVLGLVQAGGLHGLRLDGPEFDVSLTNTLTEPTLVHWHGLIPPNALDGMPGEPAALMVPGEARRYTFTAGPGTHWMHAHTLQEQSLLAAPLIVRTAEDLKADMQEVVVLLHDFSFKTPEELLAGLTGGPAKPMDHGHMNHGSMGAMPMGGGMAGMNHGAMNHGAMNHGGGAMAMDLNDIAYDAFLANDRTLDDPEVVRVEKGGRVRLRIINGASSTAFTIDTGSLKASLVAVDGQPVVPVGGNRFAMTMGQRIDLVATLPAGGGAFPVLALVEGTRSRTGLVLASADARITKLGNSGSANAPVVGLDLETRLVAAAPLAARKPDKALKVTLTGSMAPYQWGMAGLDGLKARSGERIEIAMRNQSMMAHPMHLHGHHFQVVAINGRRLSGAVRDTVVVPPMAEVTIAFDAGAPGRWAFHCHHLYHMVTGMMGLVEVA